LSTEVKALKSVSFTGNYFLSANEQLNNFAGLNACMAQPRL